MIEVGSEVANHTATLRLHVRQLNCLVVDSKVQISASRELLARLTKITNGASMQIERLTAQFWRTRAEEYRTIAKQMVTPLVVENLARWAAAADEKAECLEEEGRKVNGN